MKATKNVGTSADLSTKRHLPDSRRYRPSAATFRFEQESDSCEQNPKGQGLTIEIDDAGGGNFPVLTTSRWALDGDEASIAELVETIRRTWRAQVAYASGPACGPATGKALAGLL